MSYCHDGELDGIEVAERTQVLWRAISAYDVAADGRLTSGPFFSKGGDHISMCVADPAWGPEHKVAWMRDGCGIATVTLGDTLDVGFDRVEWAEWQTDNSGSPEYLPGHVNVYYGSSPPAMRRQAKDLSERARVLRPVGGRTR